MQEPEQRGIHGAEPTDSPVPDSSAPAARSTDRGPGWPTAGTRPPHAQQPDPPADSHPADSSGRTAVQRADDSWLTNPQPTEDTWPTDAQPPGTVWPTDAQPAEDTWPTDAQPAEDTRPTDAQPAGTMWPTDAETTDDSEVLERVLANLVASPAAAPAADDTRTSDGLATDDPRPAQPAGDSRPAEPWLAADSWSGDAQPAADTRPAAALSADGPGSADAHAGDPPSADSWQPDSETPEQSRAGSWSSDTRRSQRPRAEFWPWSDEASDEPPADSEPTDTQLADGSWSTDDQTLAQPAYADWSTEDQSLPGPHDDRRTDVTAPASLSAQPASAAGLAQALNGWRLTRTHDPLAAPPDRHSPDVPRPEDAPMVPIEDRVETARTGPDGPTGELPIIDRSDDATPAAPGRRWLVGAGVTAALLVLVGGTVVALGRTSDSPPAYSAGAPASSPAALPPDNAIPPEAEIPSDSAAPAGTATPPGATIPSDADPAHTATAALDGRTEAGFDLVEGADAVVLRTADLGGDLYRVVTRSATPRVNDSGGRVQLFLENGAATAVEVMLSSTVRWDLRVGGGVSLSTIDLSGARLAAVELAGSATQINLLLPRPDGTLTVRMSGGVNQFFVHTADEVPVRVRLGSGAGQVIVGGTSHLGVAAGALFTPDRWDETVDRIDVDAVAGMAALTIGP